MNEARVRDVLEAVKSNNQIHYASGTRELLCNFFDGVASLRTATKSDWLALMEFFDGLEARSLIGEKYFIGIRQRMEAEGLLPPPAAA